jgi:6-oxo-cyclohex-1-ene-carbonyl-CoA hydrolase
MQSCTLCETWTAYEALRFGLVTDVVPVLRSEGRVIPNPMVVTERWLDEAGRVVHGSPKSGEALARGKELFKSGTIDLAPLDACVQQLVGKLADTMPGCLRKTVESVRKHKLAHWDRNRETNRAWLSLNMLGEANLGFRAFHEGPKDKREVDFVELRRRLADGDRWSEEFIEALLPREGGKAN